MNTAMLEEMLGHLATARDDESVRVLVISSTDHMGLSAGADVREDLDRDGAIRRMQLFADLYDQLVALPEADDRRLPRRVRRRRRRGRRRLRPARRRLQHAAALPRRRARRPGRPGAAVTLCGLSVAKYLLLTSKEIAADEAHRWGLVHKVAPAARTEEAALQLAGAGRRPPARVGAPDQAMLHEWDGVVERSRDEGEGQVAWQSEGPGLGYRE